MPKTKIVKRAEAEERQDERDKRSFTDQLARLDKRPGLAAKERARIKA